MHSCALHLAAFHPILLTEFHRPGKVLTDLGQWLWHVKMQTSWKVLPSGSTRPTEIAVKSVCCKQEPVARLPVDCFLWQRLRSNCDEFC